MGGSLGASCGFARSSRCAYVSEAIGRKRAIVAISTSRALGAGFAIIVQVLVANVLLSICYRAKRRELFWAAPRER